MLRPAHALQGVAVPATVSPFACIGATMGYSTFHMLQTLWLGVIDLPTNSSEKDWDLQAKLSLLQHVDSNTMLPTSRLPSPRHILIKYRGFAS